MNLPQSPYISNFLGNAPEWYKATILGFLIINPLLLAVMGPVATGWALLGQFIFTLAMALKCYPLQPGGLLALEAVFIGLTSSETVAHEVMAAFEVILLLIFMVAGIFFMKNLLMFIFTKLLLGVRSKLRLSLLFSFVAAFLSAFLDALTVTAVIISVGVGFYNIYHKVSSTRGTGESYDVTDDSYITHKEELDQFRSFLRSLLMHAVIGTALGGVCTLVGEPQNLLIASRSEWHFGEFFLRMAPVSMPVFVVGLITCALLETTGKFGYGAKLPQSIRAILQEYDMAQEKKRGAKERAELVVQALAGVWLVIALALHLAEVGLIGLSVIVITTAFTGIINEHQLGKAFEEALPFTALLVVFFVVVAVIADQHLFTPLMDAVLSMEGSLQTTMFYVANGVLSMISDNVFVATIYINEVQQAYLQDVISRDTYDLLAVAINTGTNIPSVATPNGQAAFLFLLTSSIAPLLRLSYGRMVLMALPYTVTMGITGLLGVMIWLEPMTDWLYAMEWIMHHVPGDVAGDGAGGMGIGH